jgi:hypothetical protein
MGGFFALGASEGAKSTPDPPQDASAKDALEATLVQPGSCYRELMGSLFIWGSVGIGLVWGALTATLRGAAAHPLRRRGTVLLSMLLLAMTTALVTSRASAGAIALVSAAASYCLRLHPR